MVKGEGSLGPKLQALVKGGCIAKDKAEGLSSGQKEAIENLAQSQIYALLEVRAATGEIGFWMI